VQTLLLIQKFLKVFNAGSEIGVDAANKWVSGMSEQNGLVYFN
jgi:hypothetical protein